MSPQQVQSLAHAALIDMQKVSPTSSMPDLVNLAKLGNYGRSPSNCHRELLALVEPKVKLPEPYRQRLPFKEPLGDSEQAFFLPHELFSKIFTEYPEQFKASLVPSQDSLAEFWSQMEQNPQWEGHELRSRPGFERLCVPLGIHGDDVPITGIGKGWNSKMTIFSLFSLVAVEQKTREKMLLLYAVFERIRVSRPGCNTLHSFFRLLAWSLYWLFQGATITGDTAYSDFRPTAKWRETCWTAAAWRSWNNRSRVPLFSLSYTSCHTISLDFMHIKYLGVDQHIFGAVLELLTTIMLPKSAEENLKDVWAALQNAYRVLHTPPSARYRYLTKLSMFIRAGYAKLRGKASEVRHLGRALSRVFDDFMNDALQIHRDISRMLHFNIEMENILEQNRAKYALPEEE
ncbi:unnamed protein product, partial [Symbiodinium sp. KB8]